MDQEGILRLLEDIGLSKKTGGIYRALLGHSRMGVAELARTSGVKRATCYEHLEELLKRDFVVQTPIGKRTYYSAADPHKILASLKKKAQKFEEHINELTHMHERASNKPKIRFYEGKPALRHIYEDMFKTVGDTYSIFPAESFFESFSEEEYDEFDKTISQHAIKARDLFIADKYYKKLKAIRAKNGGEKLDKRLPPEFKTNVDVLVYTDKVALMSLRDLSAIVIENKDIAELFKNMHTLMWKSV